MRKIFAAVIGLFAIIPAFAQVKVSATLLDASNGDPVGFATVSLIKSGQTKPTKYVLSNDEGKVSLDDVKKGTYTFRAELLGYKPYSQEIKVGDKAVALGEVKMELDSEQLDAAKVSATGNPVIIKKDTIEYNASSYLTTDNDVLEDLLKKLPGVEVSDSGQVTVNGESVSKITIDGRTFFLDDPQLASKNIPAKLVNKLKVIRKKSEQAEFTGIDDGQEETVIDLNVKKGMMNGLMGNVMAGAGSDIPAQKEVDPDFRYQGNAFLGRFTEKSQISLILNSNNTNNEGAGNRMGSMMSGMMGGGMGGRMGGGGGGITTSYMAGLNAATDFFDRRMNIGGNYMLNGSDNFVDRYSVQTTHDSNFDRINNTSSTNTTGTLGHRFGLRMEHKFSENTSILFQPQINFGGGSYVQSSRDTTWNDDRAGNVTKLNDAYTDNSGENKSVSASGFLLFRQRLGIPGRTLTANVDFSVNNNDMTGINNNGTTVYTAEGKDTDVFQNFTNVSHSYNLGGRLTYTEPLGNNFYVEANYSYNWSKSKSEKETFDLNNGGIKDFVYSNNIINENRRQQIGANLLYQKANFRAQVGFAALPNYTYNSTTKYNITDGTYLPKEYEDFRWNWSPTVMVFGEMNENTNIRLFYRGNSSQPSTSQLMPVPDNSDPLNISFGNPSLTPYFSHNLNGDFRYSNRAKFSSFNVRYNGGYVQNPIVTATWYGSAGEQYSIPFNGSDKMNASMNMFFNAPIAKSDFSINGNFGGSWSNGAGYKAHDIDMSTYNEKGYYDFMDEFIANFNNKTYFDQHILVNKTNSVSANGNLRGSYRSDLLMATLGGGTRMSHTWYSIKDEKAVGGGQNQTTTTWNNNISASLTWNWLSTGISVKGDYSYRWYEGYEPAQASQNIFNAEITKTVFKTVTLALRGYDILGQNKNIMVSDDLTRGSHSESLSNSLGRYIIFSATFRFGTMGKGRGGRGPMGGGPMGGGPMGGGPGRMMGGPGGPM